MGRSADYVIVGAGIAGMTLERLLRGSSVVLLDGAPGRYKIGESIIPQHFVEPEVRSLYDIVRELPSATAKDGTLFIADDSIGGFEPFVETNYTIHVARQELEEATAAYFGTTIVRERVEAIDVERRTVTTDAGGFVANRLIIDCSGPARLVARALGLAREVWPVWSSWAYHDIVDIDDQRLFDVLRSRDKAFYRYNERLRRVEPSTRYEGFRPSHCTNLTCVGDGLWTWQIPLYRASRLSVGVVSRVGPVSAEQYREIVSRTIAPQYRTRIRPWDHSGPFNRFHVRNRFAWAADRFAGDSWALVGDAAFFGDPVYSVGTGIATNCAIQLGRALCDGGWSPKLAAAHHTLTADLYARAKRAYDGWYGGRVVTDSEVAETVQTDFLNGRAFQVKTLEAFSEMWLVSHPQDPWYAADPGRSEDIAARVSPQLEPGGVLVGWRLAAAGAFPDHLELEWDRPDAAPMALRLERVERDRAYPFKVGDLGLRYRSIVGARSPLDGQGSALVKSFGEIVAREPDFFRSLLAGAFGRTVAMAPLNGTGTGGEAPLASRAPWYVANASEGQDVTGRVAAWLSPDGVLVGWRHVSATRLGKQLHLEWDRPDAAPFRLEVEVAEAGRPYYVLIGELGVRYRQPETPTGDLDERGRALVDAFVQLVRREARSVGELVQVDGDSPSHRPSAPFVYAADMPTRKRRIDRIGIVGGGTAGYLTALALRRRHPSVAVTLLESSRIAIIGVGEATTPDLVDFLHRTLGIDELELYRQVRPTWKLGIRFLWGEPGRTFHHPFSGEHLFEACAHARDQDLQSLGAQLMARNLAPVLLEPDGRATPLFSRVPIAYHLDNERFVAFLQRKAIEAGVDRIDCTIDGVSLASDGGIDQLRASDGRALSFDRYVDATGFRSLLLEKALGVPYQSYASSLFADTAVTARVPHEGSLDPFTLAETMDAGWCWNIPHLDDNHRGYVFASSHLAVDVAESEMRAKNSRMGESRLVRFRSGRLERCWEKNVVGVGNAYAFVEPLESTALHMLVYQIGLLVDSLSEGDDEGARAKMNATVGAHWDCLRGFLALHYRFNRRLDTPFWRDCRATVDLADGEAMVAAYRDGAPLVARPDRKMLENALFRTGFFGLLGVDNVLLGQGVPSRLLVPDGERVAAFDRWARGLPAILSRALPPRQALAAYLAWLGGRSSSR